MAPGRNVHMSSLHASDSATVNVGDTNYRANHIGSGRDSYGNVTNLYRIEINHYYDGLPKISPSQSNAISFVSTGPRVQPDAPVPTVSRYSDADCSATTSDARFSEDHATLHEAAGAADLLASGNSTPRTSEGTGTTFEAIWAYYEKTNGAQSTESVRSKLLERGHEIVDSFGPKDGTHLVFRPKTEIQCGAQEQVRLWAQEILECGFDETIASGIGHAADQSGVVSTPEVELRRWSEW